MYPRTNMKFEKNFCSIDNMDSNIAFCKKYVRWGQKEHALRRKEKGLLRKTQTFLQQRWVDPYNDLPFFWEELTFLCENWIEWRLYRLGDLLAFFSYTKNHRRHLSIFGLVSNSINPLALWTDLCFASIWLFLKRIISFSIYSLICNQKLFE